MISDIMSVVLQGDKVDGSIGEINRESIAFLFCVLYILCHLKLVLKTQCNKNDPFILDYITNLKNLKLHTSGYVMITI